jgi:hypothetical protein
MQENNSDIENNIEAIEQNYEATNIRTSKESKESKPKAKREFTPARQAAFEKMQAARRKQLEQKRQQKLAEVKQKKEKKSIVEKYSKPTNVPILKRSNAIDEKEEDFSLKTSGLCEENNVSSSTDSSNYETDEETQKVIIKNFDQNQPDSKLIIKKVRNKKKVNDEQLKKIYEEIKQEDVESKCVKKKQSNRRKKILDDYFERNKDVFTQHDGEFEEAEFLIEEFDELHKRFIEYERNGLFNRLAKAEKKPRKKTKEKKKKSKK